MTISAKTIADSITVSGSRITTLQLCYPRFIHAEFMTHRVFSRNASSSRAIPVSKIIEQVRNNPAMPIHWGLNQPGMQANSQIHGLALFKVKDTWREAAITAANLAERMSLLGLHKQVANRILEPFQHIHVVMTATDFDNFFELRDHEDAQPEIHELAIQMKAAMGESIPTILNFGEWHVPYVSREELGGFGLIQNYLRGPEGAGAWNDEMFWSLVCKISAARCCRVSHLKHDGHHSTIEEDLRLCERLIGARPLHASPFEHQATPDTYGMYKLFHGNFNGWAQYRKFVEEENWPN